MTRVDLVLVLLLLAVFIPLQVVAGDCGTGMPTFLSPNDSTHTLVTDDAEVAKNTVFCHVACIDLIVFGGGMSSNSVSF